MTSARSRAIETLQVTSGVLILTGIVLLLAAYFDFPWVAGIGFQVLCMAVIVGGILIYDKAKTRKSAGIVSCTLVALVLGPAVLNAAETATWTRATPDPEPYPWTDSFVSIAYGPVCAADDGGGTAPGAPYATNELAGSAHGDGVAAAQNVLACIGLALVALGLTAGCIAVILALAAAGPIGWIGALKIAAACLVAVGTILGAIAHCFFGAGNALAQSEEWGRFFDSNDLPPEGSMPAPA